MSAQTLQLLAIGFSARWLQESAFRGGVRCHAIDFFGDADTREFGAVCTVSNWRAVPRVAASLTPEAIVVGGGFETQPAMVKRLRGIAPLLNASPKSSSASRDPRQWSAPLKSAGLLVPEMIPAAAVGKCAGELVKGEWLVKNRYAAGGNRVREWNRLRTNGELVERLRVGEYLQQRLEGEPFSLLFWLQPTVRRCLGFFRQLCGEASLGASPFQFAGAIGPLPFDEQQSRLFQRVGDNLFDHLGLSGLVGVDLIQSAAGLFAIEINPRPTATAELWELASGNESLIGKLWEAWDGRSALEVSNQNLSSTVQGKAIVYWADSRPLTVDVTRSKLLQQAWRDGWLKDIPAVGTRVVTSAPVATVFASGASVETVRDELQFRAETLLAWMQSSIS